MADNPNPPAAAAPKAAVRINDKAGIRDTFAARPDLKAVHVLEDGRHFFDKRHAEQYAKKKTTGEGEDAKEVIDEKITTLKPDATALQDEPAK